MTGGEKRSRGKHASPKEESEEPAQKKQEVSKGGDGKSEAPKIVEDGKIFFLYRPRTGMKEAHSVSEVQHFFLVLEPDKGKKRLIPIGKKKIPAKRERFFGFVLKVADSMEDLTGGMGYESHETKTAGTRSTEAARVAGEGRYSIAVKKASANTSRTLLVWKLEVPKEPGHVQQDLGIGQEGSLGLSIKNPKKGNPPRPNVGLSTKADFGVKQKLFDGKPGGYAWIPAEDPSLLDYEHAELLLVGEDGDVAAKVGHSVEEHLEEKVEEDVEHAGAEGCSDEEEEDKLLEEMKRDLAVERPGLDASPAADKEWK